MERVVQTTSAYAEGKMEKMEHLKRMAALIGTAGLLMLGGCASEEVSEETEESALASKSGTLDPTFGKGGRVVRGDAIPRAQDRVALGDRLVILQGDSIRLYDPTLGFVSTFGEKGSIALSPG